MLNSIKNVMAKIKDLPPVTEFFQGQLLPRDFILPAFSEIIYTVDQQMFPMKPGMALLIRPHSSRYLEPTAEYYERLLITFELAAEQPYLPVFPLQDQQAASSVPPPQASYRK